jgi:phosphoribosylglycinamide formyltransferase-1
MVVGFICSAGGSALFSALKIAADAGLVVRPVIFTDRDCGAEASAIAAGYENRRIPFIDKAQFSSDCAREFEVAGARNVLLFYSRVVGEPLIDCLDVMNIHPSLLPAFKGIGAVQMAFDARALLLGCSLHKVDTGMDSGLLISQVVSSNLPALSIEEAHQVSFLQKVWLTLNWLEMKVTGQESAASTFHGIHSVSLATNALSGNVLSGFRALEQREFRRS